MNHRIPRKKHKKFKKNKMQTLEHNHPDSPAAHLRYLSTKFQSRLGAQYAFRRPTKVLISNAFNDEDSRRKLSKTRHPSYSPISLMNKHFQPMVFAMNIGTPTACEIANETE
jgi:hypothetical protein